MDPPESSSSSGPVRPTRQPKESTALLMSVVRSISASESNDHRDKEKAKLDKEFKKSDSRLDELIASNHIELSDVIQAFGKVSSRLAASREKIKQIKESLANCRMLLNCRRDELKRLWLEGIEHKQVLYLLEQIDNLKGVPETIEKYKQKKQYLNATTLLVSSVETLEGSLEGVDAMKDVQNELQFKQQALQEKLIEELHRHLYVRSTGEICTRYQLARGELPSFSRQGSDRAPETHGKRPATLNQLELTPLTPTHKLKLQFRPALSQNAASPAGVLDNVNDVFEDLLLSDPEEDSAHFLAILVKCLALLGKIPDTVETVKSRMQRELVYIVRRTSQLFADNGQVFQQEATAQQINQGHFLAEFLDLIFEQFRCVAQAHECVLGNLRRTVNLPGNQGVQLYDMADFWSRVQAVIQVLLSDYLDMENSTTAKQRPPSTYVETTADVASFFAKKKPVKPKKFSLFKFDASSHAISLNSYLKEQQTVFDSSDMLNTTGKVGDAAERIFVCKPSSRNIMAIFVPVMKFIREIETALNLQEANHCALHTFVTDFVQDVFLGQVHADAVSTILANTKGSDAWKANTDLDTQKALNLSRPLLQSTLLVEKKVAELKDVMHDLPLHSEAFLDMICSILLSYKESCMAAYRGIVQPESEDRRIISATWAKDGDINRFLKSLPNWVNLLNQANKSPQRGASIDIEESSEEVRLRNKKESTMLTNNLGDAVIPAHEILNNVSQLRTLALLQESLGWFGGRIRDLAYNLPAPIESPQSPSSPTQLLTLEVPPIPESCVQALHQLAGEFEDLAETCLLVLHLEVRVHCFFYLLPVARQSSFASGVDSQDPDPEVVKLNKDLSNIDEALSTALQPRKFRCIFEGVGHLVASIIINSAHHIKRINENGVKKMCRNIFSIQQNLTNITLSREVALDHARHFFELLYHTPEEILNQIVEHGPKFTELDYRNVLQLKHRSHPGSDPADFQSQVSRLHDILNEVAVTI